MRSCWRMQRQWTSPDLVDSLTNKVLKVHGFRQVNPPCRSRCEERNLKSLQILELRVCRIELSRDFQCRARRQINDAIPEVPSGSIPIGVQNTVAAFSKHLLRRH